MGPEHFWWGGMWIFPLAMMILCIGVIYLFFGRGFVRPPWRDYERRDPVERESETALGILRKRFARGEITKDEFLEMKKELQD